MTGVGIGTAEKRGKVGGVVSEGGLQDPPAQRAALSTRDASGAAHR